MGLKATISEIQATASDFVYQEREALRDFGERAVLANIREIVVKMDAAKDIRDELEILTEHWDRIVAQRTRHKRISDIIFDREALEVEMRDFDKETADPARFKKRDYSGVDENKRRVKNQRRLKVLDNSLSALMAEWYQLEDAPFPAGKLLPADRTDMYAWTPRQYNSKNGALSSARSSVASFNGTSPNGASPRSKPPKPPTVQRQSFGTFKTSPRSQTSPRRQSL